MIIQAYAEQLSSNTSMLVSMLDAHHSECISELTPVFTMSKVRDGVALQSGYQVGHTLASYLYLHFLQDPNGLTHWFKRAREDQ